MGGSETEHIFLGDVDGRFSVSHDIESEMVVAMMMSHLRHLLTGELSTLRGVRIERLGLLGFAGVSMVWEQCI